MRHFFLLIKTSLSKKLPGYSLVELAIALVVIGLILGGILKGQELIENARLKAVLSQVNEIQLAYTSFRDKFDALPGDFKDASLRIDPSLLNGDGNGSIEGAGLSKGSEALSFWAHLSAAHLYPDPGIPPTSGTAQFGQGAPSSKIGGGFTVETDPAGTDLKGLWLALGAAQGVHGNGALLTPEQAYTLDKKGDDGNPLHGRIQAREGAGIPKGKCIKNGTYNTDTKEPACVLYFQL